MSKTKTETITVKQLRIEFLNKLNLLQTANGGRNWSLQKEDALRNAYQIKFLQADCVRKALYGCNGCGEEKECANMART